MTRTREERHIVVCGDAHGNTGYLVQAMQIAAEAGIGRVLQLGDFGVWPGARGTRFLDDVDMAAAQLGVQLEFIDGNHEDFDQLDVLARDGERRADGAVRIRGNVSWWTRGTVCEIGGRRFGYLGGTVSIDAHRRVERHSWWPQEDVTDADVERLIANTGERDLDVLVAHDVFSGIDLPSGNWDIPSDLLAAANRTRERLLRAVETVRPALYLHGHWHMNYEATRWLGDKELVVRGLGAESRNAISVLDLETLHVSGSVPSVRDLHTLRS